MLHFCFLDDLISDFSTNDWTSVSLTVGSYKSHLNHPPIPTGRYEFYPFEKFSWCLTRHLSCFCCLWKEHRGPERRIMSSFRFDTLEGKCWPFWKNKRGVGGSCWGRRSLTNDFHSYSAISSQTGIRLEPFPSDVSLASHQPAKRNPQWSEGIRENHLNPCIIFHHFSPLRAASIFFFKQCIRDNK